MRLRVFDAHAINESVPETKLRHKARIMEEADVSFGSDPKTRVENNVSALPPNSRHKSWTLQTSASGLGCVKTRTRSIAIEEVIRLRPY